MTEPDTTEGPEATSPGARTPRRNRVPLVLLCLLIVATGFAITVTYTGLPGPGALRRYPLHDLQSLSDRFNRADPGAASVDLLHSRVRVNAIVLACPNLLVGPGGNRAPQFSATDQAMIESSGPVITGPHSCPIR